MGYRKLIVSSFLALLLSSAAALCFGSTRLDLWAVLTGTGEASQSIILWQLRLPRLLAGILAGVGLSAAGVLLQSVTANALASPNIIGINSGAGFAVISLLTFAPTAGQWTPLAAFCGAFAAAMVILLAAGRLSGSKLTVLLVGIAITTLLNAAISFLSLLDEGVLAQYNHFTVGSLKAVRLRELGLPAILIGVSFASALLLAPKLNVLCLGDEAAAALGVRVKAVRLAAMACAAMSAAAVVSFAGLLGFVGLIIPHIARRLVGENPKRMLLSGGLLGGILVVLADLLGRVLLAPSEVPVGIFMSAIGAPYFLVLLLRRNRYDRIS